MKCVECVLRRPRTGKVYTTWVPEEQAVVGRWMVNAHRPRTWRIIEVHPDVAINWDPFK